MLEAGFECMFELCGTGNPTRSITRGEWIQFDGLPPHRDHPRSQRRHAAEATLAR